MKNIKFNLIETISKELSDNMQVRKTRESWGTIWYFKAGDGSCEFALYLYKDDPDDCYLSNVWVEKSKRGEGLGNQLLEMAEKTAAALGASELRLEVEKDNPFARDWYLRHGFKKMDNPGTKASRTWMKKKLTESKRKIMKNISMLYESVFSQQALEEAADGIKSIQGLEHLSRKEIEDMILDQIKERFSENDVTENEAAIVGIAINGSRGRHTARDDSDLDVVMEFSGSMKEDDVYNILHDPDSEFGEISIDGITVDVNPVKKEKSGSLKDVMARSAEYDKKFI